MPLILPQLHGRRFTFSCDAMRAGTWHYPYTSTSHGLRSGCKVSINILMFQTFGYFFHFLHSFFYILDNIRYKFTRILTLTIQQGLFRDTIMWSAEPPPVFLCASVIACFVYLIIVQFKKNVPLGTLFLWEAGGICRCKDRHFSFIFQVFLPLHTKLFVHSENWKTLYIPTFSL